MSVDNSTESEIPPGEVRRNFVLVCLALTGAFLVHSMLMVTIPVHAIRLGVSAWQLGVIFSAPSLLPLLLAIPMGGLVTRYGGRLLMMIGALLLMLGLLVIVLVDGYGGVLLGQLLLGLAQLQMVLAAQTVVSVLASGAVLERLFGWYTTCLSAGQVVGPLLAGFLIEFTAGTQASFLVMVLFSLVGVLFSPFLIGRAGEGVEVDRHSTGFRAQARLLMGSAGVKVAILVTTSSMLIMSAHASYLPVYLNELEVCATIIGVIASLRALSSMLIRPFMVKIIALCGGREMGMLLSLVCMSVGMMLMGVNEQQMLIALFTLFIGLGSGISQPLSMVVLAESVSSRQRSGALGMRLMANSLSLFLAPLCFGWLLELSGFSVAFFLVGGVVALSCLWLWIVLSGSRPGLVD